MIAGVFALIGISASQLATYLNEKRKDKRRLETDVRATSARYLGISQRIVDNLKDEEWWTDFNSARADLNFIAPRAIVERANVLFTVTLEFRSQRDTGEGPGTLEVFDAVLIARREFINELRKSLGLEPLKLGAAR